MEIPAFAGKTIKKRTALGKGGNLGPSGSVWVPIK